MLAKTFQYNFIPTKAEEEACKASNTTFRPTRILTEIRDMNPPSIMKPLNQCVIKQVLTPSEVGSGKIILQYFETFNHIFRHWTMEMASHVANGSKQNVVVLDATDENKPTSYIDMFLEAGPECKYFLLGCMDLIKELRLLAGDEIGMFWDIKTNSFQFKVLNRGN